MVQINLASTGHGSKTESYSGGLVIQYNVFPEGSDVDKRRLAKLRKAYAIIDKYVAGISGGGPCNRFFEKLPASRSFSNIWADDTIFLCFSPSQASGFYGATHSNDLDVSVTAWCLDNKNHWMIAATIVHELAHGGGAPGGQSHDAERSVHQCGFKDQYDPQILGGIHDLATQLQMAA